MKQKGHLQLEELGARILPSASPLIALPDPPDGPAHVGGRTVNQPAAGFDGLDGTVRGTLKPAVGIPDLGPAFSVQGKGKLGGLDEFTVTGFLHGTGFVAKGQATGELTLTNAHGTIKLKLEGPQQPGFAPLPGRFSFTVTGGTGAYKNLHDDGEVSLHLHQQGGATTFRLVFA
jgi:hypothetical protein